jgi:hypothetical protein
MYGPSTVEYAVNIGMYTPLERQTHESADPSIPWYCRRLVPIEPCRAYVDRQKKSGTDVAVAPQLVWIAQILYSLAGERYGP